MNLQSLRNPFFLKIELNMYLGIIEVGLFDGLSKISLTLPVWTGEALEKTVFLQTHPTVVILQNLLNPVPPIYTGQLKFPYEVFHLF